MWTYRRVWERFFKLFNFWFGRNISGGQAQRCKLLKILANPKPIIILDEPTSSLDEESIRKFNKLLIEKSAKSILIVITHSKIDLEFYSNILDLSKKIKK